MWDLESLSLVYSLDHSSNIEAIVSVTDFLASSDKGGTINIWDLKSNGDLIETFNKDNGGHLGAVSSMVFLHALNILASCSSDKTVKLWSLDLTESDQMRLLHTFDESQGGHTGWVRVIIEIENGRYIATGGDDQKVKVWDVSEVNFF